MRFYSSASFNYTSAAILSPRATALLKADWLILSLLAISAPATSNSLTARQYIKLLAHTRWGCLLEVKASLGECGALVPKDVDLPGMRWIPQRF